MPDALHPPQSVIDSWPAPNYVDPVTRGNALVVISILLTVLSALIVAARVWARFVLIRKPGLDDGLIVVALVRDLGSESQILLLTGSQAFGIAFAVTIIICTTSFQY